ncbi:dual specificity protein phosphatase family protein [uncultured Shewanella sp.]|uniref:protein-tyrosine phosphatase family protein n=1 Tax=uncultured Shewanella sp. TaxID=173975 RepID=UPI0026191A5E|nr:dual specificity protein phosphatase family protein [uncultured Shewanella sp.]
MFSHVQQSNSSQHITTDNVSTPTLGRINGHTVSALPARHSNDDTASQWQQLRDDASHNTLPLAKLTLSTNDVTVKNMDAELNNWIANIPHAKGEALINRYFTFLEKCLVAAGFEEIDEKLWRLLETQSEDDLRLLLDKVKTPPKEITYGGKGAHKYFVEALETLIQTKVKANIELQVNDFIDTLNTRSTDDIICDYQSLMAKCAQSDKGITTKEVAEQLIQGLVKQPLPLLDKIQVALTHVALTQMNDAQSFVAIVDKAHSERETLEREFNARLTACFTPCVKTSLSELWLDFQHVFCLADDNSELKKQALFQRLNDTLRPIEPKAALRLASQIRKLDMSQFTDKQQEAFAAIKHQVFINGFTHSQQVINVVKELNQNAAQQSQVQSGLTQLPTLLKGMNGVGLTNIEQDLQQILTLVLQASPITQPELKRMQTYLTELIAQPSMKDTAPLQALLSGIELKLTEYSVPVKKLTLAINQQLTQLPAHFTGDLADTLAQLKQLASNIDVLKKIVPEPQLDLSLSQALKTAISQLTQAKAEQLSANLYREKVSTTASSEYKEYLTVLFNAVSQQEQQLRLNAAVSAANVLPLDLDRNMDEHTRYKFNAHVAPGHRLVSTRRPKEDAVEYAQLMKNLGVSVLISVAEKASAQLTSELTRHGIAHVNQSKLHIQDFFKEGSLPKQQLSLIVETIKEYENKGQHVAIHCGGGDGRSGLVKAAYVLSQLPAPTKQPALTSFIDTHYNHEDVITASSEAVSNAIIRVRAQGHEKALERPEDVKALEDYYTSRIVKG